MANGRGNTGRVKRTLLACACAGAVVALYRPGHVLFDVLVAWVALAVALSPLVGEHLARRRRLTTAHRPRPASQRSRRAGYSRVRSLP
jgi:Flp pilus assembly protein TadB